MANNGNTVDTTDNNGKISPLKELLSYVKLIIIAVVIAYICTHFIIVNALVPTGSMKNTIMEGDRLIGFRLSYVFSEPERGDIAIFKYPDDETQIYIKRVIGLPGDIVTIKDGNVYINGDLLKEPYLLEQNSTEDAKNSIEQNYIVPEGHYFMMGDNRTNSLDARFWTNTYVSKDKILAKALVKYFDGSSSSIKFQLVNQDVNY